MLTPVQSPETWIVTHSLSYSSQFVILLTFGFTRHLLPQFYFQFIFQNWLRKKTTSLHQRIKIARRNRFDWIHCIKFALHNFAKSACWWRKSLSMEGWLAQNFCFFEIVFKFGSSNIENITKINIRNICVDNKNLCYMCFTWSEMYIENQSFETCKNKLFVLFTKIWNMSNLSFEFNSINSFSSYVQRWDVSLRAIFFPKKYIIIILLYDLYMYGNE